MKNIKIILIICILTGFNLKSYGENIDYNQHGITLQSIQISNTKDAALKANEQPGLQVKKNKFGFTLEPTTITPNSEKQLMRNVNGLYYSPYENEKIRKEEAQKQTEEK